MLEWDWSPFELYLDLHEHSLSITDFKIVHATANGQVFDIQWIENWETRLDDPKLAALISEVRANLATYKNKQKHRAIKIGITAVHMRFTFDCIPIYSYCNRDFQQQEFDLLIQALYPCDSSLCLASWNVEGLIIGTENIAYKI